MACTASGMGTEAVGWVSSFVLVATLSRQVWKQWNSGTSEGVSKWLFVGQFAASVGFTIYSLLLANWVFVVTNALMVVNAIVGFVIWLRWKRAADRRARGGAQDAASFAERTTSASLA